MSIMLTVKEDDYKAYILQLHTESSFGRACVGDARCHVRTVKSSENASLLN